jgi:hypothetical protein
VLSYGGTVALTHRGIDCTDDALRLAFPSTVGLDRRLVLTLTGYFDASGTHDGSETVVLAGWISSDKGWAAFDDEWRAALDNYGLTMFHMREFAHHRGEFQRWSEPQRRIRFAAFAEIVSKYALSSVAVAVPVKEFQEEFTPAAQRHVGGAYGFAASVLMMEAAQFVEESLKPEGSPFEIAYLFESGDAGVGQVMKLFQANMMDPDQAAKLHLLSFRIEDKRKFVALQAADILAYELYQDFPRQMGTSPLPRRRYNLTQLAANRSWDWRYVSRERMREDWARVLDIAARIAEAEPWPRKKLPDDWQFPDPQTKPLVLATRPKRRSHRMSTRGR